MKTPLYIDMDPLKDPLLVITQLIFRRRYHTSKEVTNGQPIIISSYPESQKCSRAEC
jgi:hypothetical protein